MFPKARVAIADARVLRKDTKSTVMSTAPELLITLLRPAAVLVASFHNRSKSSDIHLYPWEKHAPDWLSPRLDQIAAHLLAHHD